MQRETARVEVTWQQATRAAWRSHLTKLGIRSNKDLVPGLRWLVDASLESHGPTYDYVIGLVQDDNRQKGTFEQTHQYERLVFLAGSQEFTRFIRLSYWTVGLRAVLYVRPEREFGRQVYPQR
jgi:hypothetical protein